MENTQRHTGRDPMMLAAALSPYVDGPAWLSYGQHPGEDKLSAAYIIAIKDHAGALKAGEGVIGNLSSTQTTAFEAFKIVYLSKHKDWGMAKSKAEE